MIRTSNLRNLFRIVCTVIDTAVFSIIISLSIALLFHVHRKLPVLISIFAGVLVIWMMLRIMVHAYRRQRIKEKDEDRRKLENLLLMNDQEIGSKIGVPSFIMIRKAAPDTYDTLNAIRSGASTIGVVKMSAEADACLKRNAPDIVIVEAGELIRRIFGTSIADDHGTNPVSYFVNHVNKYFLLGCILFLSSFTADFKIYYRVISCICLIIAPFSGIFDDLNFHKKLRIFLDKEGDR